MTTTELQKILTKLGYPLTIDGKFGPASQAALLKALTDGPDTPLSNKDVDDAAAALGVSSPKIWAVYDVEAASNPFMEGRPTILYEPHIFSRLTNHAYDASQPTISSKSWNKKLYPGTQQGRWNQLLKATSLNPDAGLSSASYGGFQILGANHKICGYDTPWSFVYSQSRDVRSQLLAFVGFVKGKGLDVALRKGDWASFARGYNGTAYRENKYDEKLAKAFAKRSK